MKLHTTNLQTLRCPCLAEPEGLIRSHLQNTLHACSLCTCNASSRHIGSRCGELFSCSSCFHVTNFTALTYKYVVCKLVKADT